MANRRNRLDPSTLRLGDEVTLEGHSGVFTVVGTTEYTVPGEPEDDWSELTLLGADRTLFVSLADDEGVWTWTVGHKLSEDDIAEAPELHAARYKGQEPPRRFEMIGIGFEADDDEYHYKVRVVERTLDLRSGEIEVDRYKARVTDYDETAGGDGQMSLELWKGGRSLTMGQAFDGEVALTRRGSHG